ncbi:hypothetical protein Q31b_47900 [Novipirellula aureliae]|uniref:Uncharacterized protein n=1 Tax=Novipirellula aureliae TaxID=2527966 RepID=A0A5C6DNT1_9BACT|nr:hypothetical protein [Novipirellula aureliae]TWU36509.1 hypothetical protein Q31b_47900 [Novipirellula aureliae]
MPNPYRPTESLPSNTPAPRRTHRFFAVGAILLIVTAIVSFPALFLLNQDWQIIPTNTTLSGIESNGQPIELESVIQVSVTAGLSSFVIAIGCLVVGVRNQRHNRRLNAQVCD